MRRLGGALAAAALAAATAGCGEDPERRFELRTPPERSSARPLPEIARAERRAERDARIRPTPRDARRLRPVLRAWGEALRRNDLRRASRYFATPAIVSQGQDLELQTPAQVRAFNDALPCGARLRGAVRRDGRYLVATFRLTRRPKHRCTAAGGRLRVAFVLRGRKIIEWRQMPDTPGAEPGPERPPGAPEPPPEKVA